MNLIDKLLSVDKEELIKECTKTYHSKNMERLTGDGEITLRKVKERKLREWCGIKKVDILFSRIS